MRRTSGNSAQRGLVLASASPGREPIADQSRLCNGCMLVSCVSRQLQGLQQQNHKPRRPTRAASRSVAARRTSPMNFLEASLVCHMSMTLENALLKLPTGTAPQAARPTAARRAIQSRPLSAALPPYCFPCSGGVFVSGLSLRSSASCAGDGMHEPQSGSICR